MSARVSLGDKRERQRRYQRDYMRRYRAEHPELRAYNRNYLREHADERKLSRALRELAAEPELCAYGCGRAPVDRVKRIDPRTWEEVVVPYCGKC